LVSRRTVHAPNGVCMPDLRDCDATDLRLLMALQQDASRTADALAAEVGLSPSAIARRIRRLRETGIIDRDVAVLSDQAARYLSVFVDVQLDRHLLSEVEALIRRLQARDEVQLLMMISGAFDLTLLVAVPDMDAFNLFVDTMLGSDRVVRRYESRFVKKRRKFSTALPLGSPG
jgi:Lrp/AsnC family leucine-responsive transcriptional regulator